MTNFLTLQEQHKLTHCSQPTQNGPLSKHGYIEIFKNVNLKGIYTQNYNNLKGIYTIQLN